MKTTIKQLYKVAIFHPRDGIGGSWKNIHLTARNVAHAESRALALVRNGHLEHVFDRDDLSKRGFVVTDVTAVDKVFV